MSSNVARGEGWEIRRGRWQDCLSDVHAGFLVTDPPYSSLTHRGHDGQTVLDALGFASWSRVDIEELCHSWSGRVDGWWVALADHGLWLDWQEQYREIGLYPFAPIPIVIPGMSVRISGDGPSSEAVYAMVARPRNERWAAWGTTPGKYIIPPGHGKENWIIGAKPLWLMRCLLDDYTAKGSVVVDPCCGSGTTLLAAVLSGRTAIGAEQNRETFEVAVGRLRALARGRRYFDRDADPRQGTMEFEDGSDGGATAVEQMEA